MLTIEICYICGWICPRLELYDVIYQYSSNIGLPCLEKTYPNFTIWYENQITELQQTIIDHGTVQLIAYETHTIRAQRLIVDFNF